MSTINIVYTIKYYILTVKYVYYSKNMYEYYNFKNSLVAINICHVLYTKNIQYETIQFIQYLKHTEKIDLVLATKILRLISRVITDKIPPKREGLVL